MVYFLTKLANKTLHEKCFPGTLLNYIGSAISKNTSWWLLLRLSGKTVVTVFDLRRRRSEVLDNCSEKSEKTSKKTSVEVNFNPS